VLGVLVALNLILQAILRDYATALRPVSSENQNASTGHSGVTSRVPSDLVCYFCL
jgi:hypothetical protein